MSDFVKNASAYLRNGKVILVPFSKSTQGFWIATEPVLITDEEDQGIGAKVLATLSKSAENIPHPSSWKAPSLPARAAGCKSDDALTRTAKCIDIDLDAAGVEFTPTKRGGPGEGFGFLKDTIRCQPSEIEVARALHAAFAACE